MGRDLPYFYSLYNSTWTNERCIEVALALDLLQQFKGKEILEIGNVLSNYFQVHHDIVDKYDKRPNVINVDVVDFKPAKKYDLAISISTLEHVGYDESPQDNIKIVRALQNVMSLINTHGILFVTVPVGHNNVLDHYIDTQEIRFDQQHYMMRISKDNKWKQVTWNEVKNCKYDYPFAAANGLVIGINEKT